MKTNTFTPKQQSKYATKASQICGGIKPEVWVRIDQKGWMLYEYLKETNSWVVYLEMDTCDHEETIEALRETVDYYEITTK